MATHNSVYVLCILSFVLLHSASALLRPCARISVLALHATIQKSVSEWKEQLSPEAYYVLREEGTERPWTSPLNSVKDKGTFSCAGCGEPLFITSTKFDSGTGWPSFYAPIDENAVELKVDYKLIVPRTEVVCKSCGGHLGHVFDDGPQPTGKRYCMNGVALSFVTDEEDPDLAASVATRVSAAKPIEQPLAARLPGLVLNAAILALFVNAILKNL